MRVKICGITREEDARLAADLGAWAVGFIFWPGSPRAVRPEAARAIADRLPAHVKTVGVFLDQRVEYVEEVATRVDLDLVQLHGSETAADARRLTRPVIKALSVSMALTPGAEREWNNMMVLLDGRDPADPARSGGAIDWYGASAVAARRPVMLAGGLRPDTVAEALRLVRPAGVDVSSGVERVPGEKDPERLRAFFRAVAEAEEAS